MSFLKAVISLFCFVFVLGAATATGGYVWLKNEIARPGPSSAEQVFVVKSGQGLSAIARELESQGLIRDNRVMRVAARLDKSGHKIKAGEYQLARGLSVSETLSALVEGKAIQYKLTIPEGRTIAQALRIIEANALLSGEMPDVLPPEGSILPDTYFFGRGMARKDLIAQMAKAQDDLLAELWEGRQADLPLKTPQEAIIWLLLWRRKPAA